MSLKQRIVSAGRFPVWLYYWFLYYAKEQPRRKPPVIHPSTSQSTGLWCILAIYQPHRASANLIAFAAALHAAGYNVVVVHNGETSQNVIEALLPYCHSFMERSYGGRDFGSYKAGTAYISELTQNEPFIQVLYCNDSVFVKPSALSQMLVQLRAMSEDYIGAVESFDRGYHMQSWFFALSGNAFRASWYQAFWNHYVITSHRERNTIEGELGLSKLMMRHGITPRVLYSNKTSIDYFFSLDKKEWLHRLVTLSSNSKNMPLYSKLDALLTQEAHNETALFLMLKRCLSEMSEKCNPMLLLNLLLLACTPFPFLKKELVYKDLYSCAQIEQALASWRGSDAEQSREIMTYFRGRDSLRWHPFKRMLMLLGVG